MPYATMDISKPRCCSSSSFYLSLTLSLAFPLALSFCARSLSRWEHTTRIRLRSLSVARSLSLVCARAHSLSLSFSLSLSPHTGTHKTLYTHARAHTHTHTYTHTHTQKHTITLARTTHALARHTCSTTLGDRVCVCQGVSVCVLWPPSPLSGTLSTHLHSSTCPPRRRCMSLMSSRLSHSSTCPQRNPYTRRRLRCRHSDRQPGHLVISRYKRMRAVAYTRCIALFVLLRAQHCLAARYDGYL